LAFEILPGHEMRVDKSGDVHPVIAIAAAATW
jgi:hypothetical protein